MFKVNLKPDYKLLLIKYAEYLDLSGTIIWILFWPVWSWWGHKSTNTNNTANKFTKEQKPVMTNEYILMSIKNFFKQ